MIGRLLPDATLTPPRRRCVRGPIVRRCPAIRTLAEAAITQRAADVTARNAGMTKFHRYFATS
jgi:hypothetical protein